VKQNPESRSQEMVALAAKRIAGWSGLLSKRADQFSAGVWPGYFSKARGVEVWDLDSKSYVDMSIGGIGATVLGYADPDVDAAVKDAIDSGIASSLNCPEAVELAELLCEIHPWAHKARFARTGGEAMAIGVRIARAHTGRDKVAFCGYHGWHDWYLAANLTGDDALEDLLMPGLHPRGVPKTLSGTAFPFHYNRLDELEKIVTEHGSDLAAIIAEPIRGEPPVEGFFEGVGALAEKTGAVFVLDEISAGFRLCSGGAHLALEIQPDMAVFSKAMGNGYPIAAVIGIGEIMDASNRTFISSTNWTERVGFAAALATIRKHHRCNAAEHLIDMGQKVQDGWKHLGEKHSIPLGVTGIKPMGHFAFETDDPPAAKAFFIQEMLDRGFLASNLFYAMYAHTDRNVSDYLRAADDVFAELASAIRAGDLSRRLKGKPSVAGFGRLT